VLVLKQPDFELQRTVQVRGEVRFPGTYALRSKDERLMDLIDRAGGITPQAYANGIPVLPHAGRRRPRGPGSAHVLKNRHHKDNILLANGDSLFIPAYVPTVRVEGAVNSPGSSPTSRAGARLLSLGSGRRVVQGGQGTGVRPTAQRQRTRGPQAPAVLRHQQADARAGGYRDRPGARHDAHSEAASILAAVGTIVAALTTIVVVLVNHP